MRNNSVAFSERSEYAYGIMSERSENITAPSPRVTLQHVAALTGLGRTTVSDILNRDAASKYSKETRSLVYRAVKESGYTPARAAQQLARGRSGQIGLMLMRDFANPYFARIADAVERELRERGYRLQLALTDGNPETERARILQMQSDRVEGLIVGPVYETLDLEQHKNLWQGNIPLVLFGSNLAAGFDEVTLNMSAGVSTSFELLIQRGHRKIGALAIPPSRLQPDQPNPNNEFVTIAKRLGVYAPEWFEWQQDTGRFEDSHAAAVRFARRWKLADPANRPTAMVCLNDQVAMTALSAFHQEGIRCPDDISLIGHDNLPEGAYLVPALTTIDNHVELQMKQSVERLLERINNPDAPRRVYMVQPTLVERQSVRDLR